MLLREFVVDNHTIRLNQDESTYIAEIINKNGEKLFCHEYSDYEKIRPYFDEIVQIIQQSHCDIKDILVILERSTI